MENYQKEEMRMVFKENKIKPNVRIG